MASDTFTALLGLLKQGTGNNNNTWGALLNSGCFDETDLAIAGRLAISTTGGTTDLSGTPPPAGPSGAIYAILDVSGTLGSNAIIKVPNLTKLWLIRNGTSGAFTTTVKTPSGSASAAIPQGAWTWAWCDGSDNIIVGLWPLAPDGTLAAPGLSFLAESGSGIRRKGTNDLVVTVGGVDILEITGAGAGTPNTVNVLSPAALQVAGTSVFITWAVAGGTADAITTTNVPALSSLADGQLVFFRASAANATATPTFAPDGITAYTITRKGGVALIKGDIPGALAECILRYNLANTRWELLNPQAIALPPPASFKKLSIKVATNTTVAVVADFVTVTDGTSSQTLAFSATVDLGTTGVNALDTGTIAIDTWYYIWAIAKADGTAACLASTSSTAPTMPSGYTFKARIGAVQTIHGSATLYGTWQFGRKAQYVFGLAQTTAQLQLISGTQTAYTAAPVARFVPPTASRIDVVLFTIANNNLTVAAPNNSYGSGTLISTAPPLFFKNDVATNIQVMMPASWLLESTNVYYGSTSSSAALICTGWEDNL